MHNLSFKPGQVQRGVAMVEFAITLPLLLLLLLAIGEFGRMLYQYNSLLQASRDASRYAAGAVWDSDGAEPGVELIRRIKSVAVYGVTDKSNPDACPPQEAGDTDPCAPAVPGLTTDHVQVYPPDDEHVRVSITKNFCSVIGAGAGDCDGSLPGFFGSAIALDIPLTATTVMRVLR